MCEKDGSLENDTSTETQNIECLCCGETVQKKIYNDLLLQCFHCGHAYYPNTLSEEAIKKHYGYNYFHGEDYYDYQQEKERICAHLEKKLFRIKRVLSEDNHVVEIGCAYGYFLDMLKPHVALVHGVEISDEAAQYARQLIGDDSIVDKVEKLNGNYDAVILWDVIEHLVNPDRTIREIKMKMNPGGRIFITTGDFGSVAARMRGSKWRMIYPPTHLHYFTRKSMTALLHKNNFSVTSIKTVGAIHDIGETLYSISILTKNDFYRKLLTTCNRILPQGIKKIRFSINLGDIMYVEAEKMPT